MKTYKVSEDLKAKVVELQIYTDCTLVRNYRSTKNCSTCFHAKYINNDREIVCERDFPILSKDNLQAYKVDDKHVCDEYIGDR